MNEKRIEAICKKYDLPVFQNLRDNFMMIIQSTEPTKAEKWEALEIYDEWLLDLYGVND